MELSFRWYGPRDPVKLTDIRQSNAEFVVTSLHHIPTGVKWKKEDVSKHNNFIKSHNNKYNVNLKWNVVESINVHNNIKLRNKNFKKLISNYKDSVVNVSKNKIKTICYNFMPIIDWTRTQLDYKLPTDGLALRFNYIHLLVFEKFILKRLNLEKRYSVNDICSAEKIYKNMNSNDIKNLKIAIMGGLPAAEIKYTIPQFKKMIDAYKEINDNQLKENLKEFLREIIPVAEENNVKMCLHPDDPPMPLFGLPRIVSDLKDYKFVLNSYKSKSNGVTFCSGSLASNISNDVYKIFNELKDNINFIHLRNVKIEKDKKSFYESNHLNGDINFVKLIKLILKEENKRKKESRKSFKIPMRPDHGHCLLDDKNKKLNPGYSAIGRMMGLSELRGIIKAIEN